MKNNILIFPTGDKLRQRQLTARVRAEKNIFDRPTNQPAAR
jgi:hypothetical protein